MTGLLTSKDANGVLTLTLNRPERHNAFDGELVAQLTRAFAGAGDARALVLAGSGPTFSAGADLEWMRAQASASHAENEADAAAVLRMLEALDGLRLPTVAVVQGNAFGGAVGLLACCDIVLSVGTARFALSEVRLGLSPTAIGPFVARAIGERQARRWFVSGEPISADRALAIGLVHELAAADALDAARQRVLDALRLGAPGAQADAKAVARQSAPPADAARLIADRRATAEAREGMSAFLERRRPSWVR
jgi:methylglutaconyl-CoA hydratase